MSFFHINPIAIAAARASTPKSTSNPARPQTPTRKSSSGETIKPPTLPPQTGYLSKQKTPLRAAETVYYDAQPDTQEPTTSKGTVVTITFSKPGVLPPLYVTSSMSDWSLHEMAYSVNRTSGKEQVVFYKDFFDAQPGQHMYRFRVGRKTWMVDDDCEVGERMIYSLLYRSWADLSHRQGQPRHKAQHHPCRKQARQCTGTSRQQQHAPYQHYSI